MFLNKKILMLICIVSAGCSIEDREQLMLNNEKDVATLYTDTITIETSIVVLDPTITNSTGYMLFGNYKDTDLGRIVTKSYSQLNYSNASLSENSVFDSVVLHLDVAYRYGDYDKPQTINVFELGESILSRKYYQDNEVAIKSALLNEQSSFLAVPLDSPKIAVHLKKSFGEKLFNMIRSNAVEFTSQDNFATYFKGIAITGSEESNAVMGIDLASADTRVAVYYHENESKEMLSINFYLSSTYQFNYINNSLAGTPLQELGLKKEIPSTLLNNKIYINTGSSVVTKIKIPYLDQLLEENGPIIINKAELIIDNVKEKSEYSPSLQSFILLETNDNNEILYYVDEDEDLNADANTTRDSLIRAVQVNDPSKTLYYGENLVAYYNSSLNNYSAAITNYLQAVIDEKRSNTGLLLYPVGMGSNVNNLIAGDIDNKPIKLKLYYTLLKPDK